MIDTINGINGKVFNGNSNYSRKIDINYNVDEELINKLLGKDKDKAEKPKIKLPELPEPQDIVDKKGVVRKGYLVEKEPLSLMDKIKGKEAKPLAKVKADQVTKFLNSIASLGLDIKPEDVMSSNGTLNPNFKVDENGNISFRDLKAYVNGNAPEYFETQAGGWARANSDLKVIVAQNPKHLPGDDINLPHIKDIEKPHHIILPHYPGREQEFPIGGPGKYIEPSEASYILKKEQA